MSNTQHNEFTLVKKVMIGLIILNIMTITFSYYANGRGVGLACGSNTNTAACTLNSITDAINSTSRNIGTSFDNATTTPLNAGNPGGFWSGLLSYIYYIPNLVYHLILFIANIIILIGQAFYIVVTVLFSVIPAVFGTASLGIFQPIFLTIYYSVFVIITVYALYILLERISGTSITIFG